METKKQIFNTVTVSEKIKEPEDYKVILINDDFTPMDFVVSVIMNIFKKNSEEAEMLMMKVHKTGESTVGGYVYDIAATKCLQVMNVAKLNNFPLQCRIEKL